MVKTSELRVKDVVNLADGRRLGQVADLELDLGGGRVTAIVVPGPRTWWLGRSHDYVIPWERIRKIGADVIFVDLPTHTEAGGE